MIQPNAKKRKITKKKKTNHPNDDYKDMVDPATGKKGTMGGEGTRPPFTPEERRNMPRVGSMGSGKNGKTIKKAKSGTKMMKFGGTTKDNSSFAKLAPPYNKATFADKIAGAKANAGEAKNGTKMKMGGKMAKKGTSVKKAGFGDILGKAAGSGMFGLAGLAAKKKMQYGGKAASMVPPMKKGGSVKKAMMGTMAAPMMKKGGSMKKCKYGCK